MLPRKAQTESWPLEMWLLFMMKISQEESGGLERLMEVKCRDDDDAKHLKLDSFTLSIDFMAVAGEKKLRKGGGGRERVGGS